MINLNDYTDLIFTENLIEQVFCHFQTFSFAFKSFYNSSDSISCWIFFVDLDWGGERMFKCFKKKKKKKPQRKLQLQDWDLLLWCTKWRARTVTKFCGFTKISTCFCNIFQVDKVKKFKTIFHCSHLIDYILNLNQRKVTFRSFL